MTPPVQPESELQKLAADFKAFVHWAELKLHLIHQTVDPSVAAQPVSTVPPSTTTFGGTEPAGTVTDVAAVPTMNGVPVPDGMDLDVFTQLVVATQGVAAMLSNPNLHDALASSSQAWWDALGPMFREELILQAPANLKVGLSALGSAGPALVMPPDHVQAAANLAAGLK